MTFLTYGGPCGDRLMIPLPPGHARQFCIKAMQPTEGIMPQNDVVIVGGGILGLTTAWSLRNANPDLRITLLEKEKGPGLHQSGHNSGVIHAGIYYAPGSLKATLCKQGAARTKLFCEQHGIPFDTCGKLVVATEPHELPALENLGERSRANGLATTLIGGDELTEMEPNIVGLRALFSPASGIVSYARICATLRDLLAAQGVDFRFGAFVTNLDERPDEVVVETSVGDFSAGSAVACAGLQADRIAAMSGLADDFRIIPFRGEYYRLAPHLDQVVRHLIYPVPEPSLPFLGVHLTRMIGGYVTVGPNAVFSLGRETYGRSWPGAADIAASLAFPGFWRLARRFAKVGLQEMRGSLSRKVYLERCRRYCPMLTLADLQPYPSGLRAQAVGRDGRMIDDFLIRETARTLHVCNAPSPAATSAFPIGDTISARLLGKINVKPAPRAAVS